jgi:hypothetical protein
MSGTGGRRKLGLQAIRLRWRLFHREDRALRAEIFPRPGSPDKGISAAGEFPGNQLTNWGELEVL